MSTIKVKYHSYNEMPLRVYNKMIEDITDVTDETDQMVVIISAITGESQDTIYNLPMYEIQELQQGTSWLNELKSDKKFKSKSIKVGKFGDCYIDTNLRNYSISQYIDFQSFIGDVVNHPERVLSTFIIPKGKKYGEGYDQLEMMEEILDNVDVITAKEAVNFFLKRFLSSISRTLTYSVWQMKIQKMLTKDTETKNQIESMITVTRLIQHSIGSVL